MEIDQATNPITRLEERILKYMKIRRGLSSNPDQAWIIDGSPWREKESPAVIEASGINGWTMRMERLEKDGPWWGHLSHKPAPCPATNIKGMLHCGKCGGEREIMNCTTSLTMCPGRER